MTGRSRAASRQRSAFRVLVTGSRAWLDRAAVEAELAYLRGRYDSLTVVHGDCPSGADRFAREWCEGQSDRVVEERHPAEWRRHGKAAGFIRNQAMVDRGADAVVAFPMGEAHGTRHCLDAASKAGIPHVTVTPSSQRTEPWVAAIASNQAAADASAAARGVRRDAAELRDATCMWFDALPHTATLSARGWEVSWLPGRDGFTAEQARDAMKLAALSNSYRNPGLARSDRRQVVSLAHRLSVDPRDAVKLIHNAEDQARDRMRPMQGDQLPHLAIHLDVRPDLTDRVIRVDPPEAPIVQTPGAVAGRWLGSGEPLDIDWGWDR
ncbi:MAG: DUF2493 domain-containing protein [Mycobacteriaceae bacterium]|nr:DUF2493 domain-containing protein [Mycobacteriaceae bacterium]